MVLPLSVDVGANRRPWGNWLLIATTAVVFLATAQHVLLHGETDSVLVLDGPGPGLLGHVLLHADLLHLLGNMLFLWVFGNAVCARVGSLGYLVCYAVFALAAAFAHLALSDRPAIGASGAINGVVGMFFVFHPKDYVTFGLVNLGRMRELPTWTLVGLWLGLDLFGLLSGSGGIAYAAHLGGFVAGALLALLLLKAEWVDDPPGPTLLDLYWRR
ncbi:MAG: rhomboid family intramembrane serine protease [Planctomycetes bacterium]|nr:rhomboid family intramembrane serine protease [Planctomycetota bacterium]